MPQTGVFLSRVMNYSDLWNTARAALKQSGTFFLTSSQVADILGTDRVSTIEISKIETKDLPGNTHFEFRNVVSEYSWEIHFWEI